MNPDLTIVIVNYKTKELVRRLLASIFARVKGVTFEVYLVDNASADGAVEMAAREFLQVKVIANEQNFGFAQANNQALRLAAGRHILLLNPDTELIEDTPTALVRFADSHQNAGVVGCKILNSDRSRQKSVLAFPTVCSQAFIMLKLHHLLPWLPCLRRYFQNDFDYSKTAQVDQVMGSVFLITRAALERVGLFDERFFLWFEEVDYCKMVKNAGLEVCYTPETSAVHHGGQSFAQVFAPRRQRQFNDSLTKYFRKHHGVGAWLLLKALQPFSIILALIVGLLGLKRKKYA
ncbi:glycosyltransferase family 2 protein [Patescibacteria group bacterium]|nr:MAG: glycosyltransferase family 2 protein [Patescibacteria group bacterium]